MIRNDETICAPATALGGAVSLVRMSGQASFEIIRTVFFPSRKNTDLSKLKGFTIIHGEIRNRDELIDEVLISIFRAPYSYTGEDSVEISCHGSPFIVTRIMELLLRNGAVAARPGEFTQRAFINGKMDLSQAEAVADLVASGTTESHRIAIQQMRGGFSGEIAKLRSELLRFASLIELELDFGEEDVEFADRNELISMITRVKELSDRLAGSFRLGNAIRNGIPVAIVGKPNSGKSTLLNVLLNEEKAIVSDIPGTTRDSIEDTVVISGMMYRFIDTAGLRDTTDVIESLGIQRTNEKIMKASVILMVDEVLEDAVKINQRAESIRKMTEGLEKHLIIVINKTDTCDASHIEKLKSLVMPGKAESLLFISAKNNQGIETLKDSLAKLFLNENYGRNDVIISNLRHYEALTHVSDSLGRVVSGLAENVPDDLIAMDIRQAIHYLGEITGEITSDEILGNIFRNFCIGK
ncbi:MAG: tRNA uridine-5-carboxymethylaminomethyl(34) synthesis GTPase MnmE [Bacteroidales bacterium]|nr:tRNA uridine-5-carboxymethylaminomethyl(34) synthesis GTPase MnmE [Bacteroidales bacterium]